MKTGLAMAEEAYKLLNVTEVTSVISGDLYLLKRPQNSTLEDIVINVLAINNEQFQEGVFNVNIHAPNVIVSIEGNQDSTMPNLSLLSPIADIVASKFENYTGKDYSMYIDQPGMPFQDEDGSWYINQRVNYYFFQPKYKNI